MYTTYHFESAQEVTVDILEAIKTTFQSKPITIIVEEDAADYELSEEKKDILNNRLQEDESTYISAQESINQLNKKYGL